MSSKLQIKDNDSYHVVTTYRGDLTKVDIYHKGTGIHARGNAKRYHSDIYNNEVGRRLAYYRALERVAHKVLIKTIKELPSG